MATKEFLNEIEKILLEQKAKLEEELRGVATKQGGAHPGWKTEYEDVGHSDDENAAEVTTYSDNLSLEKTLESAFRDVNSALARIASGKYGDCRYCGEPIDEKRLRARPTSSACIKCKVERKAKA